MWTAPILRHRASQASVQKLGVCNADNMELVTTDGHRQKKPTYHINAFVESKPPGLQVLSYTAMVHGAEVLGRGADVRVQCA